VTVETLNPGVANGLAELEEAFPGRVASEPDGSGGAYVTITEIELGESWTVPAADLSFQLLYNYPAAAVYPYYLPAEAVPVAGMPPALQRVSWRGREVNQLSLRNSRWTPTHDNAVGCVVQTGDWLRRQ
jgi:hypothetical protein